MIPRSPTRVLAPDTRPHPPGIHPRRGSGHACLSLALAVTLGLAHGAWAAEVIVTGGGPALQLAIDAAADGAEIRIDDSQSYEPVTISKPVTVRASAGRKPRVVADPNLRDGVAVLVNGRGGAASWIGVDVVQDQAGGGGGHNVFFLARHDEAGVFTLQDCSVKIDVPEDSVDARVIGLGDVARMVNVRVSRTDQNPNALVMVFDAGGTSVFEDCRFGPNPQGHGVVNTAAPGGAVLRMVRCLFTGIGPGAKAILATDRPQVYDLVDCTFDRGIFAIYAGNAASSEGTVFNLNRCRMGPPHPGDWLVYASDGDGVKFNVTNCVIYSDAGREHQMQSERHSHEWNFVHTTFTELAAKNFRQMVFLGQDNFDGALSSRLRFQNCLVNWPASQDQLLVGCRGGLSRVRPLVSAGKNLFFVGSSNPDDPVRGLGAEVRKDPEVGPDGFHLGPMSPAIDAAVAGLSATDIDGEVRPRNAGFDLGADELDRPDRVVPFVKSTRPVDGDFDVPVNSAMVITLRQGTTLVATNSLEIRLNDQVVPIQVTSNSTLVTVTLKPAAVLLPATRYTVQARFQDTGVPAVSVTNQILFTTQPALSAAPPRLQGASDQGLVVLESEHDDRRLTRLGSRWEPVTTSDASGGLAMRAMPDAGRNVDVDTSAAPSLEFKVRFVRKGIHYVWVRGEGDSSPGPGGSDSVNVGLDGVLKASSSRISTFMVAAGYVWSNTLEDGSVARVDVPSTGDHVLTVWMREDGFAVDRLILTVDPNFTPDGLGPVESVRAPEPPRLSLDRQGEGVRISWTGSGSLQKADSLAGPWENVSAANPSVVAVEGFQRFFRLVSTP